MLRGFKGFLSHLLDFTGFRGTVPSFMGLLGILLVCFLVPPSFTAFYLNQSNFLGLSSLGYFYCTILIEFC